MPSFGEVDFVQPPANRQGMSDLAAFARQHKALGEPNRLRIVRLLKEKSLCVCEIESILELPQYAVSRHLAVLRQAGWIQGWREGTWIHYRLAEKLPQAWLDALGSLCRLWDADKLIRKDLKRLQKQRQDCA
jgi:ArsR family transcriptional regulator